jgi:hypothetical protein
MPSKIEIPFDVRTLHHKLRRAEFSADDLKKHLDALPDDADRAVQCDTRFTYTPGRRKFILHHG